MSMTLDSLVAMFATLNGERHTCEVSLSDLRDWHRQLAEAQAENRMLRLQVAALQQAVKMHMETKDEL